MAIAAKQKIVQDIKDRIDALSQEQQRLLQVEVEGEETVAALYEEMVRLDKKWVDGKITPADKDRLLVLVRFPEVLNCEKTRHPYNVALHAYYAAIAELEAHGGSVASDNAVLDGRGSNQEGTNDIKSGSNNKAAAMPSSTPDQGHSLEINEQPGTSFANFPESVEIRDNVNTPSKIVAEKITIMPTRDGQSWSSSCQFFIQIPQHRTSRHQEYG